jgi:hypothetical protein
VTALVAALEANADVISARVIADMYEDPFWHERFGERGRRFAEQDGRHHLTYLVQALVAENPHVLSEYGRWLRSVLTNRGMCSLHLDENFERLARAIAVHVEDSAPAVAYLEAARAALAYNEGEAAELETAKARVLEGAPPLSDVRAERRHVAHLFSYLTDAVALGRPEVLADHVVFLDAQASRAGEAGRTARELKELVRVLEHEPLSPPARSVAAETLRVALDRLDRLGGVHARERGSG